MDAVRMMGKAVVDTAKLTADNNCIGAAKLVTFCNAVQDNPFMAGAFHGVGEADCVINVGVSGPGVVRAALEKADCQNITEVADLVKKTAFKITRMGQLVAQQASQRLSVPFGIVDLSLAPTPAVGDSVAHILEEMGLEICGCHGTTAALALLNDAVKKGGVMASSHVGGLSGAFIPVSEDQGMIHAVNQGALDITKLEAMTAVCSVGLDMLVIPGDVTPETVSAIIADEAAIGMVNSKTTAVRVIPAIGRKAGDELNFGGLLGSGPVMELRKGNPDKFVNLGGRFPAPLQSLKQLIYNDYIVRAKDRVEKNIAVDRENADKRYAQAKQHQQDMKQEMNRLYEQNKDSWVDEIVKARIGVVRFHCHPERTNLSREGSYNDLFLINYTYLRHETQKLRVLRFFG